MFAKIQSESEAWWERFLKPYVESKTKEIEEIPEEIFWVSMGTDALLGSLKENYFKRVLKKCDLDLKISQANIINFKCQLNSVDITKS